MIKFHSMLLLLVILYGCAAPAAGIGANPASTLALPTAIPATETYTLASPTPEMVMHTPTAEAPRIWISPDLPEDFRGQLQIPQEWEQVNDHDAANLWLEIPSMWHYSMSEKPEEAVQSRWIFAAVAPFPTVQDEISLDIIRQAWTGNLDNAPGGKPLLVTQETKTALNSVWGDPQMWGPASSQGVKIVEPEALLETAWKDQPSWAIIPFELIEPRWKVLSLDGQSPLDKELDESTYPLALPIWLTGAGEAQPASPESLQLPTNRDPRQLTVLAMTGVTALSRHIGEVMEAKGVNYPARDIGERLAQADLTHISNEVSFYQECPKPGPERADMRFCSNPKYIELLQTVGTDIVELTGNHNLDWGIQPYLYTLDRYTQLGWKTYGGGKNLEEANKPLLVEHNGNKLAFIGCSPAGPEPVWATVDKPGSAPCNMMRLEKQVHDLRAQGYLPIVTFQAVETDVYAPLPAQGAPDFRRMARAGAVIVSGSQSHIPQTMTFVEGNFVHYGLGNLFFDQMKPPEARQAFIDRHVFYAGKYLGVSFLTTMLEEYARPRPMTTSERAAFLTDIFSLCDWSGQ
jgi:hypothetical protein